MLTLSLENLAVRPKTPFAEKLHKRVVELKAIVDQGGELPADAGLSLAEIIQKQTKMNIKLKFSSRMFDNFICYPTLSRGHGGTAAQPGMGPTPPAHKVLPWMHGFVDLEKVHVTGTLQKVAMLIVISLPDLKAFPADETTATILHEVGHAFNMLATLGEYVWLNYYLQEGVDVLLGTKSSRLLVEVLDMRTLTMNVDRETQAELTKNPNRATVRTAVINFFTKGQRGHLTTVTNASSWKRNEQMADWFAARLGFGLPLARSLARLPNTGTLERLSLFQKLVTVMGLGLLTPVTLYWLVKRVDREDKYMASYDTVEERIRKLRQEVLIQLRHGKLSPERRDTLLADLDSFDKLTAAVALTSPKLTQWVNRFVNANSVQQLQLENELEGLMNNGLYATHTRLQRYA